MRYGTIHRVSDFVERLIPRRGSGPYSELFVHAAIAFLKKLDQVERSNPAFTLSAHTGGAIWLLYKGRNLSFVSPAKGSYFRIGMSKNGAPEALRIAEEMRQLEDEGTGIERMQNEFVDWIQWRVYPNGLDRLVSFYSDLTVERAAADGKARAHPREFPGDLRERAYENFEASGRRCNGTRGVAPHKVAKNVAIEYDHILPHSRGGSNSEWNIQVLCEKCNGIKRATGY